MNARITPKLDDTRRRQKYLFGLTSTAILVTADVAPTLPAGMAFGLIDVDV